MTKRQREIVALLQKGYRLSASPGPEGLYMLSGDALGQVQHIMYRTIRGMLDAGLIQEKIVLGSPTFVLSVDR